MTERERWIVYPLIFFLLLLVTRDNLLKTQQVKCHELVCSRLYVETEDGRRLVSLFGKLDRGYISIYGPIEDSIDDERWTASSVPPGGATEPVVQLGVETGGGFVSFYGREDVPTVKLGHHESIQSSGLVAANKDNEPYPSSVATDSAIWGTNIRWGETNEGADLPAATSTEDNIEDEDGQASTTGAAADDQSGVGKAVESTSVDGAN